MSAALAYVLIAVAVAFGLGSFGCGILIKEDRTRRRSYHAAAMITIAVTVASAFVAGLIW